MLTNGSVESKFGEIHVWEFPHGTTVKLRKEFLVRLVQVRKRKFKSVRHLHKVVDLRIPFATFKSYLKPSNITPEFLFSITQINCRKIML